MEGALVNALEELDKEKEGYETVLKKSAEAAEAAKTGSELVVKSSNAIDNKSKTHRSNLTREIDDIERQIRVIDLSIEAQEAVLNSNTNRLNNIYVMINQLEVDLKNTELESVKAIIRKEIAALEIERVQVQQNIDRARTRITELDVERTAKTTSLNSKKSIRAKVTAFINDMDESQKIRQRSVSGYARRAQSLARRLGNQIEIIGIINDLDSIAKNAVDIDRHLQEAKAAENRDEKYQKMLDAINETSVERKDAPLEGSVSVQTVPAQFEFEFGVPSPDWITKDETLYPNRNESKWEWKYLATLKNEDKNWDAKHTSNSDGNWSSGIEALGNLGSQNIHLGAASIGIESDGMTEGQLLEMVREKEKAHRAFNKVALKAIDTLAKSISVVLGFLALILLPTGPLAVVLLLGDILVQAINGIIQWWNSGWTKFEELVRKLYPS